MSSQEGSSGDEPKPSGDSVPVMSDLVLPSTVGGSPKPQNCHSNPLGEDDHDLNLDDMFRDVSAFDPSTWSKGGGLEKGGNPEER